MDRFDQEWEFIEESKAKVRETIPALIKCASKIDENHDRNKVLVSVGSSPFWIVKAAECVSKRAPSGGSTRPIKTEKF